MLDRPHPNSALRIVDTFIQLALAVAALHIYY